MAPQRPWGHSLRLASSEPVRGRAVGEISTRATHVEVSWDALSDPGSIPGASTRVVAKRVARLLRSGVFGAIEGDVGSLSVPEGTVRSSEVGPEVVQAGSLVRSAYLKLRRTHPVGRVVEFRRRAAPGLLVGRSPSVPWRRRDGLSGAGAVAPPCCRHRSPGLGRRPPACRPSRRAGRPAATR